MRGRTRVAKWRLPGVPTLNLTASAGIRWSNASLEAAGAGFVVRLRPGVETAMLRYGDPSEVVIVGHFHDTLSEACAASTQDSCRDVFVIEEVLAEPAS